MHTYPFAVKFTIADNLEKANYFEKNLNKVFGVINYRGNERKKKYAHINALRMENTLYWKHYIKSKYAINVDRMFRALRTVDSMDAKIKNLTNLFESIFGNLKVHLFVSPYATIAHKSYKAYLKDSENELVNILDSFNTIDNYDESMVASVEKVFYGAIDIAKDNEENIVLEKVSTENIHKTIDNTWANEYTDDYIVIRLTSVDTKLLFDQNTSIYDNDPVWFRPIGCIVVEKKNTNYIEATRAILSLKEYIVDYLKEEFNYGVIQEAIKKVTIKQELEDRYKDMITKISHSLYENIDIGGKIKVFREREHSTEEYKDYLDGMASYSWGLGLLTKLHKLDNIKSKQTIVNDILSRQTRHSKERTPTQYKEDLSNFIAVCKKFSSKLCQQCAKKTLNVIEETICKINIDEESLKIIIFELVFNALKRMTNESEPNITIILKDNVIIFSNKLSNEIDSDGNSHIDKFNDIEGRGENNRMGVGSIREALSKCNYQIEAEYDNAKKMVLITLNTKKGNSS